MVRLNQVVAGLTALCAGFTQATPVSQPGQPSVKDVPLGYDANIKKLFTEESPVARVQGINLVELRRNITAAGTQSEPFIPNQQLPQHKPQKRYIIGVDDRQYNWEPGYPFGMVGRLARSDGSWCSGALIGPRHVLTARHCIPDGSVSMQFFPGWDDGWAWGSSYVEAGIYMTPANNGYACETKDDWSVLALEDRLGDGLGWFGFKFPDPSQFNIPRFSTQGYPQDRDGGNRPYLHANAQIYSSRSLECDSTGPLTGDADAEGGQSGSPFWEDDNGVYIWGVLVNGAVVGNEVWTGFASGADILDGILYVRDNWP
jgi:V8-like Glu-specific endopeptidase